MSTDALSPGADLISPTSDNSPTGSPPADVSPPEFISPVEISPVSVDPPPATPIISPEPSPDTTTPTASPPPNSEPSPPPDISPPVSPAIPPTDSPADSPNDSISSPPPDVPSVPPPNSPPISSTTPPLDLSTRPPPPSPSNVSPPSVPSPSPPPSSFLSPPSPPSYLLSPPPPLSNSTSSPSSSSSSISSTVVIGIAAGGAVCVLFLLFTLIYCFCASPKKKNSYEQQNDNGESGSVAHTSISSKGTTPLVGSGAVTPILKDDTKPAKDYSSAPTNPSPSQTKSFEPKPVPPLSAPESNENKSTMQSAASIASAASMPASMASFASSQSSHAAFSYSDLESSTGGFSPQNLLGEGGFGKVYKGVLSDGRAIAVKVLNVGGGQGEREFRAEVETISRVHHKHLVTLLGYCIANEQRLLVYEFIHNGTVDYNLHNKNKEVMEWGMRMKVALGAAKGLAYLHEDCNPRIYHRDIKSANILIDKQFEAKVADFGLAKFANDAHTHITTRVMGTFGYLAPEYAMSGKLNEKSDVYSFGVVLLELLTGRKPVDSTQPAGLESLVEWARPLLLKNQVDVLVDTRLAGVFHMEELRRMLRAASLCVRHSAAKRPKMSQVVRILEGSGDMEGMGQGMDQPGVSAQYDVFAGPSVDDYDSAEFSNNFWQNFNPSPVSNGKPKASISEPNSQNFSENVQTGSGLVHASQTGLSQNMSIGMPTPSVTAASSNFSSGEYVQGPYSGPLFISSGSAPSPEPRYMPRTNRPAVSENSMGLVPEDSEVQSADLVNFADSPVNQTTFSGLQEEDLRTMLASSSLSDKLREGR